MVANTIKMVKKLTMLKIYTQSRRELKLARRLKLALYLGASVFALSQPVLAQSSNPHAVSLYNLGLSAYKQGSPESAIIFFKRACDIDPDLADAQYNLGVLYQSERRLKEAVSRFQEVLRIKPQDADAHYQLGLALIDLGRMGEAKDQLLAIAPNNTHFVEAQKKLAGLATVPASGQTSSGGTPLEAPIDSATSGAGSTPNVQPVAPANPSTPGTNPDTTSASGLQAQTAQPQSLGNVGTPSAVMTPPTSPPGDAQPNQTTGSSMVNPGGSRQPPPNATALQPNSSISVVANGFSAPAGIAFDKQGNLYIANFLTSIIERIGADGARSQFSSGANIKGPIGLTVDDLGDVYVANWLSGTITRISPAGVSSVIVTGLKKPYYLTIDRDNNLFVSQQDDNSIVRITLPKAIGAQPH